jgi:hypothetical protein
MRQHIGQRLDVHEAMFDCHRKRITYRQIALRERAHRVRKDFIQTLTSLLAESVNLLKRGPIGREISWQIPIDRIDSECEQAL